MDIKTTELTDIEKIFNNVLEKVTTVDTVQPSLIKRELFGALKSKFPTINISQMDSNYNKLKIEYTYKEDFRGMKEYDKGEIILFFSIKAKKTKKQNK